jgi:hypothetical protein
MEQDTSHLSLRMSHNNQHLKQEGTKLEKSNSKIGLAFGVKVDISAVSFHQ